MVKELNNASERIAQQFSPVFLASLNHHKSKTHITPSQHIRQVKFDLGKTVSSKTRIYLDMKYWLLFRDVTMGRSCIKVHQSLLQKLLELVQIGQVICPVSDILLSELLTQSDVKTRTATAKLMDQLSGGISIVTINERIRTEILHWIRSYTLPKGATLPLNQLVWTKSTHFYGYLLPTLTGLSSEDEVAVQKAWFDTLSSVSLVELLETVGSDHLIPLLNPPDIAFKLNEGKFTNTLSEYSFKELLLDEVHGGIDTNWHLYREAFVYLFESAPGKKPIVTNDGEIRKITTNLIVAAFENGKIGVHLPSLRVLAETNAAIRWNSKRKYKRGDWMDMLHAAIALPFCDIFLTDHSMTTLLCSPPLQHDQIYGTTVISTAEDALSLIEKFNMQKVSKV
jgi:hypothetical protein